ncbi:MAG: ABC transporter substrate-binding protein [Verrucomicrobiota bacterium]
MAVFASSVCLAEEAEQTRKVLESMVAKGIAILKDPQLDAAGKQKQFDGLLEESGHLELMAKLALGKNGWDSLSEADRPAFVKSFTDVVKRSYYDKLAEQDAATFATEYTRNESLGKGKRALTAVMKSANTQIEVIYKLCLREERWGIYDVEVEGISLVASYRAQFDDYLAKHAPTELIAELKKGGGEFAAKRDAATPKKN